jgi:hypothetical protein
VMQGILRPPTTKTIVVLRGTKDQGGIFGAGRIFITHLNE